MKEEKFRKTKECEICGFLGQERERGGTRAHPLGRARGQEEGKPTWSDFEETNTQCGQNPHHFCCPLLFFSIFGGFLIRIKSFLGTDF